MSDITHPPHNPEVAAVNGPLKMPCGHCDAPVGEPCQDGPGGERLTRTFERTASDYYGQTVYSHPMRTLTLLSHSRHYLGRYRVLMVAGGWEGILVPGEVVLGYRVDNYWAPDTWSMIQVIRAETDNANLGYGFVPDSSVELIEFLDEDHTTSNRGVYGVRNV